MSSFTYRPRYRYALSQRNRMSSKRKYSRGFKRAYTPRNFGTTFPNALYKTGVPAQMKVCLKYNAHHSLTSGAGTASSQLFKLNSVFDPDQTGTGHQPMARDQWALLYTHYRVDKCTVKITAICPSGGGFLTVFPSTDNSSITDPVVAAESRSSTTIGVQEGGGPRTMFKSFDLCDVFGATRSTINADDLYRSVLSADPQSVGYIRISWVDEAVATGTVVNFSTEITYYTTLFSPLQQASS